MSMLGLTSSMLHLVVAISIFQDDRLSAMLMLAMSLSCLACANHLRTNGHRMGTWFYAGLMYAAMVVVHAVSMRTSMSAHDPESGHSAEGMHVARSVGSLVGWAVEFSMNAAIGLAIAVSIFSLFAASSMIVQRAWSDDGCRLGR